MVFLNNFVHADLHPGNLLVTQDRAGKCRLGILDAGMAVGFHWPPVARRCLLL
jgi:predicted unusual protein kinase regulating ubiquinone biosynthesis (AarF/ABC1/UbiB family)